VSMVRVMWEARHCHCLALVRLDAASRTFGAGGPSSLEEGGEEASWPYLDHTTPRFQDSCPWLLRDGMALRARRTSIAFSRLVMLFTRRL
jgi:hypothetical protein